MVRSWEGDVNFKLCILPCERAAQTSQWPHYSLEQLCLGTASVALKTTSIHTLYYNNDILHTEVYIRSSEITDLQKWR